MESLEQAVDEVAARTGFSGVVRVDRGGRTEVEQAYGLADRAHGIPNRPETQFGIASGAKGLTALAVAALLEDGALSLETRARSLLGVDVPLVDDRVTVEHLLAHRSGIGDYLDEDVVTDFGDYLMPVPVHRLATTEDYLAVLDGHPTKFAPGERFSYSNGGYVVLALVAERAAGMPFHELVDRRVLAPAGMGNTAYLRSDELPGSAAVGYLTADAPRTNVLHLPVRGSGDGGVYSTAADMHALWSAFFAGRIVPPARVADMVRPRSDVPREEARYGLGFWLHTAGPAARLVGADAGVSFRSVHHPGTGTTHTVLANTSQGAWPVEDLLDERLAV
jgi:CubicO group peptidase (beta-lactamase class C family)